MATASEDKPKIAELKDNVYGMTDVGKQADQYNKTTKAIGHYIGRVYGHEMKKLVLQLEESEPEEPKYPTTNDEKEKAIWSKKYDLYLKKLERYEDQKSKVFTIIMGQCSKPMRNRVESSIGYVAAEKASNVKALLRTIKDIAFDSNEKKYPPSQAAHAWKELAKVWQQDQEDLVDYYKRFISMVEMVERSYGKIAPEEIAKKDPIYSTDQEKAVESTRDKMLAFMFMDGANKRYYGMLMRDIGNDFALGNGHYPKTIEDALQVLSLYSDQKRYIKRDQNDDNEAKVVLAQTDGKNKLKCWKCGKEGHIKKDCPDLQQQMSEASNAQVPYWAGGTAR